ncbi:sensor domain-containing diguanylate cyclase [Sedimentibacter sp.]|uniref:sensor domain-containing diguanylate cyclase n=1 Tax=Sedimentibacter sp. TaxID=1960295 RepID=UPI0028AD0948|nr:sensor domain-containing diguanylate cyclase [Sedimentibacter sp.]
MNFQQKYADELKKLKENEDYIEVFRFTMDRRHDLNEMKEVIEGLMKFSKENNLNKVKAWIYYYLGWYHFDRYHYEKAAESFLISNDIFNLLNYKHGLIYACNGLTNVYCQIGQFNLSTEWGLKGISLCEETDNKKALVILLVNTGINYIQMKNYKKGKEILNSIKITEQELTKKQLVSLNLSFAEIEINIGDPYLALTYIDLVSRNEKEFKVTSEVCEIYKLKGMAYVKLNLYDIAEQEFEQAYDFANKNELLYEKCSVAIEWTKLSIILGRKQKAIKELLEVIEICKSKRIKVLLREAYHILYTIYKDFNKPYEALKCLEEYMQIDDEMYDYEQNQLMAKMNFKHTKREADQYKLLYDRTELLSNIGQKILSNLSISSIVKIIDEEINKLINTDYFGIAVYDSDLDQATYYFVGENTKIKDVIHFDGENETSFGSYCIRNKKDIIISNAQKEYKKYIDRFPTDFKGTEGKSEMKSVIYTPLIINDKAVGLMSVQSSEENAYDLNDLNTLKILANYSAIAIENAINYKRVEDKATYDNLTSFLSKFEIIRLGEIIYEKHKVNKLKFSVAMIDLDNFKNVNDSFGHIYGDKALTMVADTISSCIRNTDYIGRYGGDEFLLICPGLGEPEAIDVAERIRKTIENKIFDLGDGILVSVTLSIGVHEFKEVDKSFLDVLKKADKCLYFAKGSNRNLVICN